MSKEELEKKYGVKIQKKESLFYVYNVFDRLVFIAPTLSAVEKGLSDRL